MGVNEHERQSNIILGQKEKKEQFVVRKDMGVIEHARLLNIRFICILK
jgi:hypothetical protein